MTRYTEKNKTKKTDTLGYAKDYVSEGFSVIPLEPKGKKPALASWKEFQARKPTDQELEKWFRDTNNNIGIVTGKLSGIVVVDIDTDEAAIFAKENLPETRRVKTGKGVHLYYRYPQGAEIRNFQRRDDLPGIDLRADGGYVVAPPSIHESGDGYYWVNPDQPLADFPEDILPLNQQRKTQLKELYEGVEEGERNNALARLIGSFIKDGATIVDCHKMAQIWNKVNKPPLSADEVEKTVNSIYEKYQRELPNHSVMNLQKSVCATQNDFSLTLLGDLLNEPVQDIKWVVEDMLPVGGFSILGSKPKTGKSTLVRYLALCIANGKQFLERDVKKGNVIYYAMEEIKPAIIKHFKDMGATGKEHIHVYSGCSSTQALEALEEQIGNIKPVLVIIDPLFKLARVDNVNDYREILDSLEPILRLARDTGAHLLCVHHTNKSGNQNIDSILGSIGITGSVDTTILMKRDGNNRTIQTQQRYGHDLEETVLNFDSVTRTLSLGQGKREVDISTKCDEIFNVLKSDKNKYFTEDEILSRVEGKTGTLRVALRNLVSNTRIRRLGSGVKKDPYKYSFPVSSYNKEQENKKNDI